MLISAASFDLTALEKMIMRFFLVFFITKHTRVSCFDFIFHFMSLCFHTCVSELAKVRQSKVEQSKSKQKEKIPPNCLGFCNLVEIAEGVFPRWAGWENDPMSKSYRGNSQYHLIHIFSTVKKKKKSSKKMKSIICAIISISPKGNNFLSHQIKRNEKN